MCHTELCLATAFLGILLGFGLLLYLGLRLRKSLLAKNQGFHAQQAWNLVAKQAIAANFSEADLLFGTWQDGSATLQIFTVKNRGNEILGQVEFPMGARELKMQLGKESFKIEFLTTLNRSAILTSEHNAIPLAKYTRISMFGKHKFEICERAEIFISKRFGWSPLRRIHYYRGDKLIGMIQNISPSVQAGKIAFLPSSIPLPIRIFILAL